MTKYIYAVCHGDDIWNECVEAQTLEDAEHKVIYIYHLHIGDTNITDYKEFQFKLEKVSGLIISDLMNINDF